MVGKTSMTDPKRPAGWYEYVEPPENVIANMTPWPELFRPRLVTAEQYDAISREVDAMGLTEPHEIVAAQSRLYEERSLKNEQVVKDQLTTADILAIRDWLIARDRRHPQLYEAQVQSFKDADTAANNNDKSMWALNYDYYRSIDEPYTLLLVPAIVRNDVRLAIEQFYRDA